MAKLYLFHQQNKQNEIKITKTLQIIAQKNTFSNILSLPQNLHCLLFYKARRYPQWKRASPYDGLGITTLTFTFDVSIWKSQPSKLIILLLKTKILYQFETFSLIIKTFCPYFFHYSNKRFYLCVQLSKRKEYVWNCSDTECKKTNAGVA